MDKQAIGMQRTARLKQSFGLDPTLFSSYRLDSFEVLPGNDEAYYMACSYLGLTDKAENVFDVMTEAEAEAWYAARPIYHHFLTFAGGCGRGKTRLALGMGIATIEKIGDPAFYYQVADLLAQIRRTFNDDDTGKYDLIMGRCRHPGLLILDDLGMQKNTDWAVEQLDSIIDYRYVERYETIFTTNCKPEQLPPRMRSRLMEGEKVELTGDDYRELIAERREATRQANKIIRRA